MKLQISIGIIIGAQMINPWIEWLLRVVYLILIWLLFCGTLYAYMDKIGLVLKALIDYYITRRQDSIDKMLRDELQKSKLSHLN